MIIILPFYLKIPLPSYPKHHCIRTDKLTKDSQSVGWELQSMIPMSFKLFCAPPPGRSDQVLPGIGSFGRPHCQGLCAPYGPKGAGRDSPLTDTHPLFTIPPCPLCPPLIYLSIGNRFLPRIAINAWPAAIKGGFCPSGALTGNGVMSYRRLIGSRGLFGPR